MEDVVINVDECDHIKELKAENNGLKMELLNKTEQTKQSRNFKPHGYQMDEIMGNQDSEIYDETNDWTKQNYKTIRGWQSDIEKSSLIHGEILNTVFNNLQNITILCLVMGVVISLFSALSITLGFLNHKWVPLAFNILILISGAVITISTGIIKIKNWENLLLILSRLVEKLDSVWFLIDTELSMSSDQRVNAKDFIKRCDGEYTFLMRQTPPINPDVYSAADKKYKERLYNNHMWMLNFRKQVQNELV